MIDQLVARIKETVPALRLVGRAAEFQAAVEANPKATPACYVVPVQEQPGRSISADVLQQEVIATVGVILVVKNVGDAMGAGASIDLEELRKAVRRQVYGWQASAELDPFERGRGHLLAFRDGHVWWQDQFITSYYDRSAL